MTAGKSPFSEVTGSRTEGESLSGSGKTGAGDWAASPEGLALRGGFRRSLALLEPWSGPGHSHPGG